MNPLRPSSFRVVVLAALGWSLAACCAPQSTRTAAASVVRRMESAALQRDKAFGDVLRVAAQSYFEALAEQQRSRLAVKRAELSLDVWRRTDTKRVELANMIERQLEDALKTSVDRLNSEIEQNKARADGSKANQDKDMFLRAQLAATLAIAQRENAKAQESLAKDLAAKRDEVLQSIDAQLPSSLVAIDAAAEAKAVVDAWAGEGKDDYAASMSEAARELERFVMLDSPLSLALGGFGSAFSASFGALLSGKANQLVGKLQDSIQGVITKVGADLDGKLAAVGK